MPFFVIFKIKWEEKTGSQIFLRSSVVDLKEKTGKLNTISQNICKIGKFLCHYITGKLAVFPPASRGVVMVRDLTGKSSVEIFNLQKILA